MKYDTKELRRALDLCKDLTEIDISIDPKEHMIIKFTDPLGELQNEITLYPMRGDSVSKFAEIKTIKRL